MRRFIILFALILLCLTFIFIPKQIFVRQKDEKKFFTGYGYVNPCSVAFVDFLSPSHCSTVCFLADYFGFDPYLLFAIIKVESNGNLKAIGDKGKSYGPYQAYLPTLEMFLKKWLTEDFFLATYIALKELTECQKTGMLHHYNGARAYAYRVLREYEALKRKKSKK